MPRHQDRSSRGDQPAVQRPRLRAGPQRNVQHRRAEQRHLPAGPVHERRRLQHAVHERHVHQHHRPAASQRRHDQRRQDLQDQVHLRHVAAQRLFRNDAHQRSGYDQHHIRTDGPSAAHPHSHSDGRRCGDGPHRRPTHLPHRNPRKQ